MTDVSMPMADMRKLDEISAGGLIWIDHHKSAIEDYLQSVVSDGNFLTSFLKNGIAACELTWQLLFPNEPIPDAITLLGQYDTWRKDNITLWENEILPFQFGMRQICNSPETFPEHLFTSPTTAIDDIICDGTAILKYIGKTNETLCRRASFEHEFHGVRAICVNICGGNRDVFKSVYDESKHDIMMPFFFDGVKWIFSLYTTKGDIDCSILAKIRGGGGHMKAAGFEAMTLKEIFGKE